jgi:uncharacterized delta-60 repeat protein
MKIVNLKFQLAASLIAFLFSFISISIQAQDGAIDPSFNPADAGFSKGDGADNGILSTVIQSDGKILIGGQFSSYNGIAANRIARLNADGSLDQGFISGGASGGAAIVYTIALQSDGKILVGGEYSVFNGTAREGRHITRLNADGSLDLGFNPRFGPNGAVTKVVLQSDGKILIGGVFSVYNSAPRSGIARLNEDGSPDPLFNPSTGANNIIRAIALQSDGKILIGGDFISFNGAPRRYIARLHADGSLDTGFNPDSGANNNNSVYAIAPQDDGKILIGGAFAFSALIYCFARLNTDGSLDTGFNTIGG